MIYYVRNWIIYPVKSKTEYFITFTFLCSARNRIIVLIYYRKAGIKLAKNNTETNAYGEKIAPKKNTKQTAKKPAAKKTEAKGLFKKPAQKKVQTKKQNKQGAPEIHPETGLPLHATNHKSVKKTPLRIIPLGGLNEIGKNMTLFECANDMFIVDCGLAFPDSDMPGVDIVLPDFTYVEQNADKIRGIVITHGHEDHIGGLAYLLKKVNVPVYATRLTIGLIEGKLKEHGILNSAKLNVVTPRQPIFTV